LHKFGQAFWKCWNSKFNCKSNCVRQVDGIADDKIIVNKFAEYFEQVCTPFNFARNEECKASYEKTRINYFGFPIADKDKFDVELLSNIVSGMKNGKAAGLDDLTCEHLKFSHPIVIVILCKLFNVFVSKGHIPSCFGASYTVPIPKCDAHTKNVSVDDFRGISISPVISKLFELSLLDRFGNFFVTSDNQFGFKKQLGCRDAIYTVRNVIEHYVNKGSTVNVCALDLSKAFDKTNHYILLMRLMERCLPVQILSICESWFQLSTTCIRWNGQV
jgi:hypothetical protein